MGGAEAAGVWRGVYATHLNFFFSYYLLSSTDNNIFFEGAELVDEGHPNTCDPTTHMTMAPSSGRRSAPTKEQLEDRKVGIALHWRCGCSDKKRSDFD